jgi:hypothetical protein
MRHGRLVATGLATGALLGFVGELLRPRLRTRPVPPPSRLDLTDGGAGPVRTPGATPYTDAVTLAMAARGLGTDRLAVATDGDGHG